MSATPREDLPPPNPEQDSRWQGVTSYGVAVVLTVGTLLLRQNLSVFFGDRPLLVLFMIPIVVSAMIGGAGPGMLATALAAGLSAYFLIPPVHSFHMAHGYDAFQWTALVVSGGLVSLLSGLLHRTRAVDARRWRHLIAARDQLNQNKIVFQAAFEQAALGMTLIAPDGELLRVNRKLCEISGYGADELVGRNFQDIAHPEEQRDNLAELRQMLDGKFQTLSLEKRCMRKAGDFVWVGITVTLVRRPDDKPDYFIAVVEDIQRRKAEQAALRASEAALRQAQQQAGVGNWEWDLATGAHRWSEEIYRIYGLDPSQPPLGYPEVERCFTAESWPTLVGAVEKCIADNVPYECDLEVVRPDGTRRWVMARGRPRLDDGGRLAGLSGTVHDITARKYAETTVRSSEQRFRRLFRQAPIPMANVLDGGASLEVNWRFEEVFGYTESDLPDVAAWWPLAYPDPDYRAEVIAVWNAAVELAVRTGTDVEPRQYAVTCRNGDVRQVIISGIDIEGQLLVTFVDVTEQKNSEDALRQSQAAMLKTQSEARVAALNLMEDALAARNRAEAANQALRESEQRSLMAQEGAHVGIYKWDAKDDTIYWSPECGKLHGAPNQSAWTFSEWRNHAFPEDAARVEAEMRRALASDEPIEVEYRVRHPSGEIRWISSKGRAQYDDAGKVANISGIVLDITDRKRDEDQLRKLVQAIEQSPESIFITNLVNEIEYVNEAFLRKTGYSREEVIGRNPHLLNSGHTPQATYADLWATLTRGETWKGEFLNRRKDGSEYVEFAIITPLRQSDGTVTHYVAVQEDVTEKKHIGEELDRYRHHLEELVVSRTSELEAARAEADAANRAKSAFLANMSHEIRTPMNAIIGLTYLMRDSKPTPEQSMRLDKIDASARHLLSIINDILDLSKIDAGHLELEQTDFALSSLLDNVVSLVSNLAQVKGLNIESQSEGVPLWLYGDATRLRQALLNYAGNAVKFTDSGTIRLNARLLEDGGDTLLVRFEVRDTGIGVAAEKLPLLFTSFAQADVSTTRKFGGTGLGLAITRRLAQMMGGTAGAESVEGQGSTFWFTARLQRGHGVMPVEHFEKSFHAEAELRRKHAGARLLLAEDNEINREVALELLHGVGLEVDVAENGVVALEKVQANAYDLVLMDMQMPEMDGLEATRAIRALPQHALLPVLAMTANAFEDDRRACLAAGMNDFIPKPVIPGDLYATVLRWLSTPGVAPSPTVKPALPEPKAPSSHERLATIGLFDIPGLDSSQALSVVKGDAMKYRRLLNMFVDMHSEDMKRVEDAIAARDIQTAIRVNHGLRGVSALLGATRFLACANELDTALRKKAPLTECKRLAGLGAAELSFLVNAIRALPEDFNAETVEVVPSRHREQMLDHLKILLAQDDTRSNRLARELSGPLLDRLGIRFAEFNHQVERFQYEDALHTLLSSEKP